MTPVTLREIEAALRNAGLLLKEAEKDGSVDNISCDSSEEQTKKTLFICKGINFKREYLLSAAEKGAFCYLAEKDMDASLPFILVSDVRRAIPVVCKVFFNDPSSRFLTAGITGTKGKTSTVYMLRSILSEHFGERTGFISTNGAASGATEIKKSNSTPEALPLNRILHRFDVDGVKAAVVEVSSQGLWYNRVDGINFDVGVFINISLDHISPTEHKNFEEYLDAKALLLTKCRMGIVNADEEYSEYVVKRATCERLISVSAKGKADADLRAKNVSLENGVSFETEGLFSCRISLPCEGGFNVTNALCAAAAAFLMGCSVEEIEKGLSKTEISGRMEIIDFADRTVIVDYAHNALSFESVFSFIKEKYPRRPVTCLFGCIGDKALQRRKQLPEIAVRHADKIILTEDDPGSEKTEDILAEVEKYLFFTSVPYKKIFDREEAVKTAVLESVPGEVIFLAGKGHEKTQNVKGKAVFYRGDRNIAEEFLQKIAEKAVK